MNSRSKLLIPILTAIGAGVLFSSGVASAAPSMENSEVNSPTGQTRSQLIHSSATIAGIDSSDRSVLLKTSDGTENWVRVPDSVQGFDRLKVGDKVVTEGQFRLKPGSKVEALAPGQAAPPTSAAELDKLKAQNPQQQQQQRGGRRRGSGG